MKLAEACDILGVDASDNEKSARSKYKKLALRWHPDKCKPDDNKIATYRS
jgi:DnaJ-class molecular chaperone